MINTVSEHADLLYSTNIKKKISYHIPVYAADFVVKIFKFFYHTNDFNFRWNDRQGFCCYCQVSVFRSLNYI